MKLSKGISGVYEIRNKANGALYIGSSKDLRERFLSHRTALRSGKHVNEKLMSDWAEFGEDSFEFAVLAILEHSELRPTEQRIYDARVSDGVRCYNYFSHVTSPTVGTHLSDEHKEKISMKKKGIPKSIETRLRMSIARLGRTFPKKQLSTLII